MTTIDWPKDHEGFPYIEKDPDALLDYRMDWSGWLEAGDTLSNAVWTLDPGISKASEQIDETGATVWISGGTPGESYNATCRVTTSVGRIEDRTIRIKVADR